MENDRFPSQYALEGLNAGGAALFHQSSPDRKETLPSAAQMMQQALQMWLLFTSLVCDEWKKPSMNESNPSIEILFFIGCSPVTHAPHIQAPESVLGSECENKQNNILNTNSLTISRKIQMSHPSVQCCEGHIKDLYFWGSQALFLLEW